MTVLEMIAFGTLMIVCFFIGARLGQMTSKGEEIKMPNFNPIEAIKEQREEKEAREKAEKELEKLDVILKNIERYDGTGAGQEDVPKG